MENYAGFGEYTDHEVGRLTDSLKDLGVYDNTIIIYIAGDNGMSAEGGLEGTLNEMAAFNGVPDTTQNILAHLDDIGGPNSFPHIPVGWALAGDTPFQWTKQIASHYGGTRNGMVISWPAGIKDAGGIRTQWHHVIDITPTLLAAAKLPQPKTVDGIKQKPMEGVSMVYTFANPKAPTTHNTQYFEMFGNRGIYHDGWTAVTRHSIPWDIAIKTPSFTDDKWELYNTNDDFSQSQDLAAKNPAKLKELQQLFLAEAEKYNVLPLDDRRVERFIPSIAGRPSTMWGRTSVTLYPGMTAMLENSTLDLKNRSHTITAEIECRKKTRTASSSRRADASADGVSMSKTASSSTATTGWIASASPSNPRTRCRPAKSPPDSSSTMTAAESERAAPGRLIVNGEKVGEGRIEKTQPFIFSADETEDVGEDLGTPVTEDYKEGDNKFTGTIERSLFPRRRRLPRSPRTRSPRTPSSRRG